MDLVPLTSPQEPRAAPAVPADQVDDDLARDLSGWQRRRRLVILTLVTVSLVGPAVGIVARSGLGGKAAFLFPATLGFVVAVGLAVFSSRGTQATLPVRIVWLVAIAGLGCALFAVGGANWLTALAVAAAAFGNLLASTRLAWVGVAACCAAGLAISAAEQLDYGNTLAAALVPALAGLLSYSAARRNALMARLQRTRGELTRMAVAEERLRIARDLHDLLGHSLSLIALKAELAGRVIGTDPDRAAREIAELETVTRRSLTEVRQAVTSYRQPSLAAELAAARRMLAAAGVDCRVEAPTAYSFPAQVDALLAWTVREGATNIVRHAAARRAGIRIELTDGLVRAELTDDGAGPAGGHGPAGDCPQGTGGAAAGGGSGLAGLAERAVRLGGTMQAGTAGRHGFRVRVEVPLAAEDPGTAEDPGGELSASQAGPRERLP
jgi:two-component system sensor histidine kinase DesK